MTKELGPNMDHGQIVAKRVDQGRVDGFERAREAENAKAKMRRKFRVMIKHVEVCWYTTDCCSLLGGFVLLRVNSFSLNLLWKIKKMLVIFYAGYIVSERCRDVDKRCFMWYRYCDYNSFIRANCKRTCRLCYRGNFFVLNAAYATEVNFCVKFTMNLRRMP